MFGILLSVMAKQIKKAAKKVEKKVVSQVLVDQKIKLGKYEINLVVHPESSDSDREQLLDRLRKQISVWGGQVTRTDEAGKKMLAYEIKKCNEAWYYFMDADMASDKISDLNDKITFEEKVLRHLIVRAE